MNGWRRVAGAAATVAIALCLAGCTSPGPSKAVVRPPSAARPPMTATMIRGIPILGQLVGTYFAGQGLGQPHPATISLGGDGTSWVKKIAWNSWGGPTAVGVGTGYWEGPGQIAAGATPEPATIEAFDRETCAGKPMYGAVEWYFPEQGQHFDPAHYEDICTGQSVDLTCPLFYVQATALLQSRPSTRGDVAESPTCAGSSWAQALMLTKYSDRHGSGVPIGFATFHRESGGRWVVVASFIHRDVSTFRGPPAAYCRTLAATGAPSSLACSPATTQPYPSGRPDW